ncbi:MAG TPA: AAA family ATPase [Gemmatimonadales bacterium]
MSGSTAASSVPHPRLTLVTLGGAALLRPDDSADTLLRPGKALATLVYLAASPGRTASREHLVDLLWADLDPDDARRALRQTVWFIRQRVGDDLLMGHAERLTLSHTVHSDRDAFLEAVESGEPERAVELYGGDFVPQIAVPGGAEFEHWADLERDRLKHAFLRTGELAVRQHLSRAQWREAEQLARRMRDSDTNRESNWRLVIECYLSADDRVCAGIEADVLEQFLSTAHREPEPATRALLALAKETGADTHGAGGRKTLVAELVGREQEFARIIGAWHEARQGRGRHVHITGAPGIGKTRLVNDVHARLRATGARAVYIRANPGERFIPYLFAADLAAGLTCLPGAAAVSPAAADALVAVNPSLSSQYPTAGNTSGGDDALRHRVLALGELLREVAHEQPVALLFDDVHWTDPASRRLLTGLLGKVADTAALVVTTARPIAGLHMEEQVAERIGLVPLSVPDVGALLASLGGLPDEPWAAELPERLHAATGGSPLLILETLQLELERRTLAIANGHWECPDPAALDAELEEGSALKTRIAQLQREERWLLLLLAVAGHPLPIELLARAADRTAEALADPVASLEQRGLLARTGEGWEPGHDELADRALETADADAVRAAHRALGRVLAHTADDDRELLFRAGRHLAAAGDDTALARVYRRWVRSPWARMSGGGARELAAELLGDLATAEKVSCLVSQLPLHVRLGLTTRPRALAAAATVALAVTGASALVFGRSEPEPPDVYLTAFHLLGDSAMRIAIPLHRSSWGQGRSGVLDDATIQRSVLPAGVGVGIAPSPDGNAWIIGRIVADSGGRELFLHRPNGREVRLTYSPGDDNMPTWAPDGRGIVFSTVRWSSRHHYDVAIMDLASGQTRALTHNDHSDNGPHWSPDGTRVAFARDYWDLRSTEVCWITVDGRTERCLGTPAGARVRLLGWRTEREVFVQTTGHLAGVLLQMDIDAGSVSVVDSSVLDAGWNVSADGRWIACLCRRADQPRREWLVYPSDRPDLAKRAQLGPEFPASYAVFWPGGRAEPAYVDHLAIQSPSHQVPLDAVHRLWVEGFDPAGRPLPVPIVSWRSSDTVVATVAADGTVRPRRLGAVTIQASAGGWRRDSVALAILPTASTTILEERWSGPLTRSWVPYGIPVPTLAPGSDGTPAFWHRGDSSFHSGVYSRRAFDARRGLGVEAMVSTRVEALQWQYLSVQLDAALDSAGLVGWDHRSGAPPSHGDAQRSCGVRYPDGDGFQNLNRIGGPPGRVPVDTSLRSGRWYTLRLQIFPDGRCGVAIDGQPLARSHTPLALDRPFRVHLTGKSVRTRILVGPLEVWEGVRGDVDWSRLDAESRR